MDSSIPKRTENMMRHLRMGICAAMAAVAVLGTLVGGARTAAAEDISPPYYLALGDSLSQGVQPNAGGISSTVQGYADDLYAYYRRSVPGLKLAKLGCSGETTRTMIKGGICNYRLQSQLAQATKFLSTHRVILVTLDIGSNNVDSCVTGLSSIGTIAPPYTIDTTCVAAGIEVASTDLGIILGALRQAAGSSVPIVGMNYYDPFLAAWVQGSAGQTVATESVELGVIFNLVLAGVYKVSHVPVADVESAYQTTNFTMLPLLGVPTNVGVICALTWMCAPPPFGSNIHANATGYAVIAAAFVRVIPPVHE